MRRTLQLPIFLVFFLGVRLVRGVQIFEPVGKKLLGRHALGGDFGGLFLYLGFLGLFGFEFGDLVQKKTNGKKKGEQTKKEDKVDCLQGANPVLPQGEGPPRGNSRNFFFIAFLELFQIFKKQNV